MATAKKPGNSIAKPGALFNAATAIALLEQFSNSQEIDVSRLKFHEGDSSEIAAEIERREFGATSADELFGGGDAVSGKDYVGVVFSLTDVTYQPSTKKGDGLPFYAVLHGVDTNGEVVAITCGARSVVRKASLAKENGWLPRWLVITSTETKAGNEALDLKAAPKEEVPF